MAAITTYSAVGNREDLTGLVAVLGEKKTPLFELAKKVTAKAAYHEWLEDQLANPAENASSENANFGRDGTETRTRKGNYCQIVKKEATVSGTQLAVANAGSSDEMEYQMEKKLKEIGRDVEYAMCQGTKTAGDANTPRKMGSLLSQVDNSMKGTYTAAGITDTDFNNQAQKIAEAGGDPTDCFVSGALKRAISAFTTPVSRTKEGDSKKITTVIDIYDGDFGITKMHHDIMMPANTVFMVDASYVEVATLRPIHKEEASIISDGRTKVLIGELTCALKNCKAGAVYTKDGTS